MNGVRKVRLDVGRDASPPVKKKARLMSQEEESGEQDQSEVRGCEKGEDKQEGGKAPNPKAKARGKGKANGKPCPPPKQNASTSHCGQTCGKEVGRKVLWADGLIEIAVGHSDGKDRKSC